MLTRLLAHGVGPFEHLDLDLSDGNGNPHLGPHIIAGVNGSGKSTVLRAISWCFAIKGREGFPVGIWKHLLRGQDSAAQVFVTLYGAVQTSYGAVLSDEPEEAKRTTVPRPLITPSWAEAEGWRRVTPAGPGMERWRLGGQLSILGRRLCIAAYAPSLNLQYLEEEKLANQSDSRHSANQSLGFVTTVHNEVVQRWWLDLFAREALTDDPALKDLLKRTRTGLEEAVREMLDPSIRIRTATEHGLSLMVELYGQLLNLSQIPDGVRAVLGWLADFLRRRENVLWDADVTQTRPSILMIDEIDAHLHPRWQRRILPALKKALPDVQIIVTTHSPFVISSCPGARVHVLDLDDHGNATARPPQDAPVGASVAATLHDIFGVDSSFDIETEDQLNRWNQLKRAEAAGSLSGADCDELKTLTATLASKNEELSAIVLSPPSLPPEFVDALLRG